MLATDIDTYPTGSLLHELARLGITLRLAGDDQIEVRAPRGSLTQELREAVSREKPTLIDWLRRARGDLPDAANLPLIVPDLEALYEPFLPSDLQQSFLIGSREGFEYHVRPHQYMEFEFDDLEPERFEAALNRVLRRHRRSLVVARPDMRMQTVRDPEPVTVRVTDLRGRPDEEVTRHLERVRAETCRREPRHESWPWLEPEITRYGSGRARLHWNNNNIFTDAPSGVALISDAIRAYHDPDLDLPELDVSFRDCVLALAELEESPLGRAAEKYWTDRMAAWPDAPDLPLVAGSEHRGRSMLNRRELSLPADVWSALKRRAEASGITPSNALLAAHAEVLASWSGSRHFLLNNMISHRPLPLHPRMAEVLGNFASLYPLEVDWRHDEAFRDRARRLQNRVLDDVAHAYYSGAKVLQKLNQVRQTPGRAICPYAVGSALFVGPAEQPFFAMLETPQTLLDTEFWELRDGRLLVIWDVIDTMFPDGVPGAMLDAYARLVRRLATDPDAWSQHGFDLLPDDQRQQRVTLNHSARPVPAGLLHDALPVRAADRPDHLAVVASGSRLTYADLHRRASRLAGRLRDEGVRAGDRVAVLLPKGADQPVAVLGVLLAGGVYVPVDPRWPADRIDLLVADTSAAAVLTDVEGSDTPFAPVPRRPEDPAYIIFTSGSTGRPKGAVLDHRGPLNTVTDINERFGVTSDDVLFGVSSLCFDLSVYDVFGALAAGATLVLPGDHETEPASWLDLVAAERVTVWNSVPALMQLFAEAAEAAGRVYPDLRVVLLSGDWVPVTLPDLVRRIAPGARVVSLGGATEASIWSICYPVGAVDPAWPSIPYGRPLAGQTWHILDDLGRDAPTWVPGQLYIGGAGVALGYWNDPERTAAAFVTHPRTGERLYRTGDLGRYLPDGDIEFLGRTDYQIKIQGYRVEPGEIEHAITNFPGAARAAVLARTSGAGRQLVAFVVADPDGPGVDPDALRVDLAGRLPGYLVPHQVQVLDMLPLTPNGKTDRRALEGLWSAGNEDRAEYTGPRDDTEAALIDIWESVLDTRPVGVHDDFFDLGGQSFAALRVSGLIAERLDRQVPLGVLLEHRTVAGLAAWLTARAGTWSPLVRLAKRDGDGWFLVHPAGGSVVSYRALADQAGTTVHALQAPDTVTTVENLAEMYVRAITETQPHGPYRVGGWSSGAVIAAEIARQLEHRGHRVERLLVIDAPAPLMPRQVDDGTLPLWFLEDLDLGLSAADLRDLAELPPDERLAAGLERAGSDLRSGDLTGPYATFRQVVRACNSYRGTRLDARVTVVRAATEVVTEFAGHPCSAADDWGWSELSSSPVHTRILPGTHHTLLIDRRAVDTIAALMD
ncbi:amino acid adenylation domain-containing protein [Micromonospora sp. CA-259024]|uniref:non-ribosomal peptide synthetase n=1 Tax=Micromonospora sp. CA-259024 TaxID=3239965 RepID=UPI003D926916